jgi:ubiquinone/menaquinone biosynthesis C-methylase UbiE
MCPESRKPLIVDWENNTISSEDGKSTFPVVNGIFEMIDTSHDSISKAYDDVSDVYDNLLTSSGFLLSTYNKIVWGLHDEEYVSQVLSYVPDGADQTILDIPVGTGVFTVDLHRQIEKNSRVVVADYSAGMLVKAKGRYQARGLENIVYMHADVGRLPIQDASTDVLLTMNGLHAFPDKKKALSEMARVLKPGGRLVGCSYIKGERRFTDMFINVVYKRMGAFTPPFYELETFKEEWSRYFSFDVLENVKSILVFSGIRNENEVR